MSKPKQKQKARQQQDAKPRGRRKFFILSALVLMLGIAAAVTLLRGANGGFDALNGRWLRPDGGYIFEIRAVDANGKIDAFYLNPQPINVAKAEATRDGATRSPRTPMAQWTSTSARKRRRVWRVTGWIPVRRRAGSSGSGSMPRRSPSSTRHGSCRTLRT